jgi:hypothetical protein
MRKSNWTPSIVPGGGDHDVFLVLDDFGRNGRVWREADVETTDLETVTADLLSGNLTTRCGWSASTPLRVGRKTYPPTWLASFAAAATNKAATSRSPCKNLLTNTKVGIGTCSCRCPYASRDRWADRDKPGAGHS